MFVKKGASGGPLLVRSGSNPKDSVVIGINSLGWQNQGIVAMRLIDHNVAGFINTLVNQNVDELYKVIEKYNNIIKDSHSGYSISGWSHGYMDEDNGLWKKDMYTVDFGVNKRKYGGYKRGEDDIFGFTPKPYGYARLESFGDSLAQMAVFDDRLELDMNEQYLYQVPYTILHIISALVIIFICCGIYCILLLLMAVSTYFLTQYKKQAQQSQVI